MATLRLNGIEKSFGNKKVLDDINLELEEGVFTAFLGKAGSGKTTLMQIIAGTLKQDGGKIYRGDKDISNVPPRRRGVAMVSQGYNLYPNLSAFENIASPLRARKAPEEEVQKAVKEEARVLGIEHLLQNKPYELSGGEAQRTALGRTFLNDADVYLLDEPLTGLDYKLREDMQYELKQILQRSSLHKKNILYATPNYQEVLAICQKTVLMNEGRVLWYGDTMEGYHYPPSVEFARHFYDPPMNLFEAQLVSSEGKRFIEVPNLIHLPVDHLMEQLKGETYVVGIPTNAFALERELGGLEMTLNLTLTDVTPAGTVMHMHLGSQKVNGYLPYPKHIDSGNLKLYVNPEDFYVFDGQNGTLVLKYEGE